MLTPYAEALARVLENVSLAGVEFVPLRSAHGRILGAPVIATAPNPRFDNSVVDGYGIRAAETPGRFLLLGESAAGDDGLISLPSGTACRIFTGAPIPADVDCVVMQEDVAREDRWVTIPPTKRGDNIRRAGEEYEAGTPLLESGLVLNAAHIGVLASNGLSEVPVLIRPKVAVIATGRELVEPGLPLEEGQIYDANGYALAAALESLGTEVVSLKRVEDDPVATLAALEDAFERADWVVTSGGVSVGDHDSVKDAASGLDFETRVWRVKIKPGKPFLFAERGTQKLFGLPGNPVASLVTLQLFIRPTLWKSFGWSPHLESHVALAGDPLPPVGDRDEFLRGVWDGEKVSLDRSQESHMLTGLARANVLIRREAGSETVATGEQVTVIPLKWSLAP